MLLSVTGFESTKTVQIRIYNFTTSTEVVAWTSTGVTERADGQGYSVYYYNYTLTAGSEYIVDWKDNSTPVNTASEGISALQSNLDAKVSLTALASVCTEGRLAELDTANLITDVANVKTDTAAILVDTGTTLDGKIDTIDTILDTLKTHLIISQKAINDASPTTLKFITTLTEATNDYWNKAVIQFTSGANTGVIRSIKDYVGGTKEITLETTLPVAPSNGDAFSIVMLRAFHLGGLDPAEVEVAALAAVTSYDPPTRAEATTDKEAIITQVDANETKIDVIDGIVDDIKTEVLTHPTTGEINTNLSASHGSGVWGLEPSFGDTLVNHDTGGVDNLRYLTAGGIGIDEAVIKAFLKTDYDAGSRGEVNVKGRAVTDVNGKWEIGMYLDTGNTYTIQSYKPGEYGPDIKEVTI